MKKVLLAAVLSFFFQPLMSQETGESAALIVGAASAEELDETVLEELEAFSARRVEINIWSRSKLLSSGLFSPYQVASLLDYRSRFGDILSANELAVVDGFNPAFASVLEPYLSFNSLRRPGELPEKEKGGGSVLARSALKNGDFNWGLKGKYGYGSRIEAAFTLGSPAGGPLFPPSSATGYIEACGRRGRGRLVLGDFNARFGQGLGLWSGFSLSGLPSAAYFSRRPTGISPSWSYSRSGLRGIAYEYSPGRLRLSSMAGTANNGTMLAAFNLGWFARIGELSVTALAGSGKDFSLPLSTLRFSADGRLSVRGVDVFGEGAYDAVNDKAALVGGVSFKTGEKCRISLLGRVYGPGFDSNLTGPLRSSTKTSDEIGISAAADMSGWTLSGDWCLRPEAARHQLKFLLSREILLSERFTVKVRAQERLRDYDLRNRTDLRCDLCLSGGPYALNSRMEMVLSRDAGLLSYLEAGRKDDSSSFWIRGTLFRIDFWDDRIYVYERDAPGSFNVPAYSGRGWALSAVCSLKWAFSGGERLKLNMRASTVRYSFMKEPKPSRCELKIQAALDF